jgi:DNA segregation ATPase FtsK/SpoIIIE, S-DNA-T family
MRIGFESVIGHEDVELSVVAADVRLSELVRTLTSKNVSVVRVDGVSINVTEFVSEVLTTRGATLSIVEPQQGHRAARDAVATLWQCGGIDGGWCQPMAPGRYELSELAASNGTTVSSDATMATLDVDESGRVTISVVRDGLSLDDRPLKEQAVWTNQLLVVAGRVFRIGPPPAYDDLRRAMSRGGGRPFTRPARHMPSELDMAVTLADIETTTTKARRLPLITMLAPIPASAAMTLMMGPRALIFAVMSPLMVIGSWAEDKRQNRLDRKIDAKKRYEALAEVRVELQARVLEERVHHRAGQPDLGEILDRAHNRLPTLWERRLSHPDALTVSIGIVDAPSELSIVADRRNLLSTDATVALQTVGLVPLVPCVVSLRTDRGIGIVGDRMATASILRALIMQLVVLHGPADVSISIFTSDAQVDEHDWLKWVPHGVEAGVFQVFVDDHEARSAARVLRPLDEKNSLFGSFSSGTKATQRVRIVVVDDLRHVSGRQASLAALLTSTSPDLRFLIVASDPNDLPDVCTTVVETRRLRSRTSGGSPENDPVVATIRTPAQRKSTTDVIVHGLSLNVASRIARRLACLEDPEHDSGGAVSVPDRVDLRSLLGLGNSEGTDESIEAIQRSASLAIQKNWIAMHRRAPKATLGIGVEGPVIVDFVADGPHALIAGTTGAGKSELLRTLVISLAVAVPPDQLNVLLVDYKGGAAFDACRDLPHVVGMVTDLDEHLSRRVLRSLSAELKYREHRLRDLGASDIEEVFASAARNQERSPLARLIVVVDEFATLAAELPDFVQALVDVAQRGRSLGIHLVLATQRPAGVLDAKIKANTNLRIALRVQEESDSDDVIGSKIAANIDRRIPGRGIIRLGAGELVDFQTAWSTAPIQIGKKSERIQVRPFRLYDQPSVNPPSADSSIGVHSINEVHTDKDGGDSNGTRRCASDPTGVLNGANAIGDSGTIVQPSDELLGTELDVAVRAVKDAFSALGLAVPRIPFRDALSGDIPIQHLARFSQGADAVTGHVALSSSERSTDPTQANLSEADRISPTHLTVRHLTSRHANRPAAGPNLINLIAFGVIDEPDDQRQSVYSLDLSSNGSLIAYGINGSGTTTLLKTLAIQAALTMSPNELFLYGIDADTNDLQSLAGWPHVGGIASIDNLPYIARLLKTVARELQKRRSARSGGSGSPLDGGSGEAKVLLLIDNFGTFRQTLSDDPIFESGLALLDSIIRDGPSFGIYTLITAKQERAVPSSIAAQIDRRFLFRLADSSTYMSFGIRPADVPELGPGRFLIAGDAQLNQVQVCLPSRESQVPAAVSGQMASQVPRVPAVPLNVRLSNVESILNKVPLPQEVGLLKVPIGMSIESGSVAALRLRGGEHAMILGPSRSGKSLLARHILSFVTALDPALLVAVISTRPGPLSVPIPQTVLVSDPDEIEAFVDLVLETGKRRLLVIDDADRLDNPSFDRLVKAKDDLLTILAISRPDAMHGYGFWAKGLNVSRTGIITKPTSQDGDLLRISLPSRLPKVGNSTVVLTNDGEIQLVQMIEFEPVSS